jgi:Rrf2 family transcriptional regulator, nitric oxide-sensitive transcriptional repressor
VNKIHRKLEYALISLKHMNQKRPGELTTVKEICQKYETPFDATARVMQQMVQGKFLKSEQGAYGGYLIQRDLSKVSLRELIDNVVGSVEISKCISDSPGDAHCEIRDKCNIMAPIFSLNERLIRFYDEINILELLTVGERKKVLEIAPPQSAGDSLQ